MEDDLSTRDEAPNTPEQFKFIWSGAAKAHKGWPLVKRLLELIDLWPILWKVIAGIVVFLVWVNRDGVLAFIQSLPGGGP